MASCAARSRLLAVPPLFLLLLSAVFAAPSAAAEAPDEFYLTVRVKGEFRQVLDDLKKAIRVNNFFVGEITNIDSALRKRGELAGLGVSHYKIVGFCNLSFAAQAIRIHPDLGVFMPCRMAVYQEKGSREVVIAAMRPTYMARVFRDPRVRELGFRLEKILLRILDAVPF